MNIPIAVNRISSVKINEKVLRGGAMAVRDDLVFRAVSLIAPFIEHIDHTAV